MTVALPAESPRELIGNAAQILKGAIRSSLGAYRLLRTEDMDRAQALLAKADQQLRADAARVCTPSASLIGALNSGDGTYRP